MKLETTTRGNGATVKANGRMDATWSGHVKETMDGLIRNGQHHLLLDAADIHYLSSAGIRTLLRIQRDLARLNGSFAIIHPSRFVEDTLRMTGLQELMQRPTPSPPTRQTTPKSKDSPVANTAANNTEFPAPTHPGMEIHSFTVPAKRPLTVSRPASWEPWQPVADSEILPMECPTGTFSIGIGAAAPSPAEARPRMGEFLAAHGFVAWLAGDGSEVPDYMEASGQLVPRIQTIDALQATGDPSLLLRFQPQQREGHLTLSDLLLMGFHQTRAPAIAFLGLMEIEGLVGAALQRSPGAIQPDDQPADFPRIRDWIDFCGERLHHRQQAMVIAFATSDDSHPMAKALPPLGVRNLRAHAHALVLPYRALPQGRIDCLQTITTTLAELEPLNILHLLRDSRPEGGLGESAFIRGACWYAALTDYKENLS